MSSLPSNEFLDPIFEKEDLIEDLKGAYIKYVGGGTKGFTKFSKKIRSLGDQRPKYFMAQ